MCICRLDNAFRQIRYRQYVENSRRTNMCTFQYVCIGNYAYQAQCCLKSWLQGFVPVSLFRCIHQCSSTGFTKPGGDGTSKATYPVVLLLQPATQVLPRHQSHLKKSSLLQWSYELHHPQSEKCTCTCVYISLYVRDRAREQEMTTDKKNS